MAATDVVGPSVFDERRFQHFNQQVAPERDLKDGYMTLAGRTDSEAFGCLGRFIVHYEPDITATSANWTTRCAPTSKSETLTRRCRDRVAVRSPNRSGRNREFLGSRTR